MRRILLAVCTLAALATVQAAQAQTSPHKKAPRKSLHEEFSGQGYGIAGCGLGSIAFGQQHGIIQVVAATLNGSSGTQTFGISSGTSNCEGLSSAQSAAIFIDGNQEQLKKDAARGHGETIVSLSRILKCSDSETLGHALQHDYSDLFGTDHSPSQISNILHHKIQTESNYKAICGRVG